MQTLEEKMMAANKARTELIAVDPDINSKWTPNAVKLIKQKQKKRMPPHPPMSPYS